jgi:hypothetical protein
MALHNTGKLGRHLGDLELEPSLHEAGKPLILTVILLLFGWNRQAKRV